MEIIYLYFSLAILMFALAAYLEFHFRKKHKDYASLED